VRISRRVVVASLTVSLVGYLVFAGVSWAAAPSAPGDVCAAIPRDLVERFVPGTRPDPVRAGSPWDQRCTVVAADYPPKTAAYGRWSELWVSYRRCHEPPLHPRAQTDCARRQFAAAKRPGSGGTLREVPGLGEAAFVTVPADPHLGSGPYLLVLRGADLVAVNFSAQPSTADLMVAAEVELAKAILAGVR
jgi:hypothetical protein